MLRCYFLKKKNISEYIRNLHPKDVAYGLDSSDRCMSRDRIYLNDLYFYSVQWTEKIDANFCNQNCDQLDCREEILSE